MGNKERRRRRYTRQTAQPIREHPVQVSVTGLQPLMVKPKEKQTCLTQ